ASSYPACIAVKTAQLQSQAAAVKYLRCLREATMLQGKNIAKQEVLMQVAEKLISDYPGLLNLNQFITDLTSDCGLEAFRPDWQETQNRNITRTPTLILRSPNKAIMLTGYRPYSVLLEAIKQVAPAIEPSVNPISIDAYKRFWGSITEREIAEIL
ncbi:MAG: DsbA oxidoreductase, partial [Segetibacter sp.]|nr:DsbA oxidoreductase [Segetibacter sp.]